MEESAELKGLMLRFYETISRGDLSMVEDGFSDEPGGLWIGTDPKEWWDSRAKVLNAWRAQLVELGGPTDIKPGPLQAWQRGDVGWAADRPTAVLPDGSKIEFRLTAVFERDHPWRFVQVHLSVGVPNEEVTGKVLTV